MHKTYLNQIHSLVIYRVIIYKDDMKKLTPHRKNSAHNLDIHASWKIKSSSIEFTITVNDYINSYVNKEFVVNSWNNVGLWDFDVVEVFISREAKLPYLELQSSPLNQYFSLIVSKPRLETNTPINLKVNTTVSSQNPWVTTFDIPFKDIPGSGNILYGNCFSCLGSAKNRGYYALNINDDEVPDYHRPELFIKLGDIIER